MRQEMTWPCNLTTGDGGLDCFLVLQSRPNLWIRLALWFCSPATCRGALNKEMGRFFYCPAVCRGGILQNSGTVIGCVAQLSGYLVDRADGVVM